MLLLLGIAVFIRAFPRPPNIEPVMASMMPVAKKHGAIAAAFFAAFAMLLADALMARVGWWSLYTAAAYALVAYGAAIYLQDKRGVKHYAAFSIVGTLFFDVTTAVAFALNFGISIPAAMVAQIPFTLMHLAGNVALAVVAAPLIEKYVLETPAVELQPEATPAAN